MVDVTAFEAERAVLDKSELMSNQQLKQEKTYSRESYHVQNQAAWAWSSPKPS
jgi:hypothetical protein